MVLEVEYSSVVHSSLWRRSGSRRRKIAQRATSVIGVAHTCRTVLVEAL